MNDLLYNYLLYTVTIKPNTLLAMSRWQSCGLFILRKHGGTASKGVV